MDVRVLTLPDGLDPADYLLKESSQALLSLTKSAPDALEFKMRRVCEGFDPIEDTHRANIAVEQMLDLLSKVPRSQLMANEQFLLRRNQVLARLARRFMIQEDELRNRLRQLSDRVARTQRPSDDLLGERTQVAPRAAAGPGTTNTASVPAPHGIAASSRSDTATSPQEAKRERLARPADLSPIERELLELIISAPVLAPLILERVQPDWIESAIAAKC